jgi:hypothetical protein
MVTVMVWYLFYKNRKIVINKLGIHGFIVPIRDPLTFLTYSGVTIFDMGEKIGK